MKCSKCKGLGYAQPPHSDVCKTCKGKGELCMTIKIISDYCSYIEGHIYEMPDIDAEAIVMSGNAVYC